MITQFARCIHRWIVLIGFLLPLALVGPVWIYWRFASPAPTPDEELRLFLLAVGVSLGGGVWNLVPFLVYHRLSASRLAVSTLVEPNLRDPCYTGTLGAGVASFGASAALSVMVSLDIFISRPATMSRYAIGYPVIILLVLAMMLVGYVAGWVSGSLFAGIQWWRRN